MYKFIHEEPVQDDVHGFKTTHHTKRIEFHVEDDAGLDEICDSFQHFLKANGYEFDGDVEIVPQKNKESVPQKSKSEDYKSKMNYNMWDKIPSSYSLNSATPEEWDKAYNKLGRGKV
tara:strand:- start:2365 stop:2715 length:351 start_codon:yes stop_codon:yes gene_type:complete